MRRFWLFGFVVAALVVTVPARQAALPDTLDKVAAKWVEDTFKKMTLDDKVGQLVVTSANTTYLSSDTEAFESLARKIKNLRLGGVHVFGGAEAAPNVLLGNAYGSVILGQPLEAASLLNRLQNAFMCGCLGVDDKRRLAALNAFQIVSANDAHACDQAALHIREDCRHPLIRRQRLHVVCN